jgi:hypothetical protein
MEKMKYEIEKNDLNHILGYIKDLEDLLTDRISDCHGVKGAMQARHCYIFYRERLYEIKGKIQSSCKSKEDEPV